MAEYEPLIPIATEKADSPKKGFSLFGSRKVVPSATQVKVQPVKQPEQPVPVTEPKTVKCIVSNKCHCCVDDTVIGMRLVTINSLYSIPHTIRHRQFDKGEQTFPAKSLNIVRIIKVPLGFTGEYQYEVNASYHDVGYPDKQPIKIRVTGLLVASFKDGHCYGTKFTNGKYKYYIVKYK